MNDPDFAELEMIVERLVRVVRASGLRKRVMREELLSHVIDVYAEEFARHGNDRIALANTRRRFGVLEELEREFQASVPFYERLWSSLEKENLMSRWLWWIAGIAIPFGPAIILPALALYRQEGVLQLFPLILGGLITLIGLGMAAYGIKQHFAHPA